MADLKKNQFDINGDMESKMFEAAIFTNKLSLPVSPKNIKGESWKQGATEKELVQTGNLLELYKHPEKYEYTIQY